MLCALAILWYLLAVRAGRVSVGQLAFDGIRPILQPMKSVDTAMMESGMFEPLRMD